MQHSLKAVQEVRKLGADAVEELETFREAQKEDRRQQALLMIQVDEIFAQRGWK